MEQVEALWTKRIRALKFKFARIILDVRKDCLALDNWRITVQRRHVAVFERQEKHKRLMLAK